MTAVALDHTHLATPVGRLGIAWSDAGVERVWFADDGPPVAGVGPEIGDDPFGAVDQLRAWFAGERTGFDLPLVPRGSPFQLAVWSALQRIPYGTTVTYGELASTVGQPGGARAVGGANHDNPLPILVPCHRVVAAGGRLGGFGGGVHRKRLLLDLELRHAFGRHAFRLGA